MSLIKAIFVLSLSVLFVNSSYGAKILGVFHGPSFSHQQLSSKLLFELAARGHEVTYVVPKQFTPKKPIKNLKTVEIELDPYSLGSMPNVFELSNMGTLQKELMVDFIGILFTELALNQTSIKNLLKSNEKFDLVIIEQFFNEAFKGFCYHFKAPCVVLNPVGASRWTDGQMGNPHFPSITPELSLLYSNNMNFFQRLHNTLLYAVGTAFFYLYTLPNQNKLLQKYFPDAPDISELYYNTSLMLLNSHASISSVLPEVPNMIQIGGYHIDPPKKLPKDLQEYLDGAKDGAIYFSLGSHIPAHTMPEEMRTAIVKVFSKLKQKVLWKWGNDSIPDQPENVKLSKWFPQSEILAHPNVVLFISHGGLLSTIETVYHGKPIVGIPILGDQEMNVLNAEINGFAKVVLLKDLTEETLENTLKEVLNNPKYTENVKRRSKILHDQPIKPLDNAMFWIEYVLRHNGATHLRTSALDLRWYQLISLDVMVFMIVLTFVICYYAFKLSQMLIRTICYKTVQKKLTQKQNEKKKQ